MRKITFYVYDNDRVVEADIPDITHNPFFRSSLMKEIPSLIEKFDKEFNTYVSTINHAVDDNLKLLFSDTEEGSSHSLEAILFPSVEENRKLESKINTLYLGVLAALKQHSKLDGNTRDWLKQLGKYAESKIIETPWHMPVSRELYYLALLQKSPEDFKRHIENDYLSKHVIEYTSALNAARADFPKEVNWGSSKAFKEAIQTYTDNIKAVHNKFGDGAVTRLITALDGKRQEREVKYGVFGKLLNFFYFKEKRQKKAYIHLKEVVSIRGFITQASDKAQNLQNHCDKIANLIEANNTFRILSNNFLESPTQTTEVELIKLKNSMETLAENEVAKRQIENFYFSASTVILDFLNNFTEDNVDNVDSINVLTKGIKLFSSINAIQGIDNNEAKNRIIEALKNKADIFKQPEIGIAYIQMLRDDVRVAALHNADLDLYLVKRLDQYQAWNTVKTFKNDVISNDFSEEKIEIFFQSTIALLAEDSTPAMKGACREILAEVRRDVFTLLEEESLDEVQLTRLQNYLKLYKSDKLDIPNNDILADFLKDREEIIGIFIKKINNVSSLEALTKIKKEISQLWPDSIESIYINLHNQSERPFEIKEGHRLDQLPSFIKCDHEAKNYVVSIGEITLEPGQQMACFCNPLMTNDKLKQLAKVLNDKKQALSKATHHAAKVKKSLEDKLQSLKEGRSNRDTLWSAFTGDPKAKLTQQNIRKHTGKLAEDYISEMNTAIVFASSEEEKTDIYQNILQDVEEVAQNFNKGFTEVLDQPERQAFAEVWGLSVDPINRDRLVGLWGFLNQVKEKLGKVPGISEVHQKVGAGIMHKMQQTATQNPGFMHQFLGGMNAQQLTGLNDTFAVGFKELDLDSGVDLLASADLIGDKAVTGGGATVLRQSLLFSQVSELIKQELRDYLNIDIEQHLATEQHKEKMRIKEEKAKAELQAKEQKFIASDKSPAEKLKDQKQQTLEIQKTLLRERELAATRRVKEKQQEKVCLEKLEQHAKFLLAEWPSMRLNAMRFNISPAAQDIRADLQKTLSQFVNKECLFTLEDVQNLAKRITYLHGLIIQDDQEPIHQFCATNKVSVQTLKKYQEFLPKIATNLILTEGKTKNLRHWLSKHVELVKILDKIDGKAIDPKAPSYLMFSDLKVLFDKIDQLNKDINMKEDNVFDLIGFIRKLPVNIVDKLPPPLSKIVKELQYSFGDRLSQSVKKILNDAIKNQSPGMKLKIAQLNKGEFYKLICEIFPNEKERALWFANVKSTADGSVTSNQQYNRLQAVAKMQKQTKPLRRVPSALFEVDTPSEDGTSLYQHKPKRSISIFSEDSDSDSDTNNKKDNKQIDFGFMSRSSNVFSERDEEQDSKPLTPEINLEDYFGPPSYGPSSST